MANDGLKLLFLQGNAYSMKFIHTPEDLRPFAGFLHRPEEEGYTVIIAGPQQDYAPEKTGRELNQFPTQRVSMSIHTWPPGKAHGSHHHDDWEQIYYVFAGQAQITVGHETMTVGAGGSAFMPPKVEHDIVAVGDQPLVAAVVTCVLDEANGSAR